jgi:hypothetical protein
MSLYYFEYELMFKKQNLAAMSMNFIIFIVFLNQVWEGTRYEQFYSKKFLIAMGILYVIFIGINVFLLLTNLQNNYLLYPDTTKTLDIFTKGINVVNVTYFIAFIFYNSLKGRKKKEGNHYLDDCSDLVTSIDPDKVQRV